jgi:hypothetical protein
VDPPSFSEVASVEPPFAPQDAAKSAKAQTKMMSDRFTLNFPLKDCAVDTVDGSWISTSINRPWFSVYHDNARVTQDTL